MGSKEFETVAVIGLGYTGLPTAAFLANSGLRVIGVDTDDAKVDEVNRGNVPFTEPGFDTFLKGVVKSGSLTAQTSMPSADAFIIAVPTPLDDGSEADLSHVYAAVDAITSVLVAGDLVILESTCPPQTTQNLANYTISKRPDLSLDPALPNSVFFAHAPERVLPGNIMVEMAENDRIVGGINPIATDKAQDLYRSFVVGTIHETDAATAEMVKLTENTFRDINIAFANELSMIAENLSLDVSKIIHLANQHPRVHIHQPGLGVGGHCLPIDPWFIISAAPSVSNLISAGREVNEAKLLHVSQKLMATLEGRSEKEFAFLGLTYKPDINDTRHSPAIELVSSIAKNSPDKTFYVSDPHLDSLPAELTDHDNIIFVPIEQALRVVRLAMVLVDHTYFADLNISQNAHLEVVNLTSS